MAFDRAKTIKLAEKHVKSGKLLDAVAEYKKLADDNPRDMNVINKLGDLLARAGKTQEANRYFLRIAEFYAKDGFFLKAIAMYKKISKIDPANLDCLQRLAGLYTKQGLTIEARAQYLQVADLMVKRNQLQPAAEILPRVLELDPENVKVRKTFGEILVRIGKPAEAGAEFAQLARILFGKGRNDEAFLVIRKGSRVTGGEDEILSLLLEILRSGEQPVESILAAAEEIAGIHQDKPLPIALLAEACRRAGETVRAEKVFNRVNALLETNGVSRPEVAEIVGRFHLGANRMGEAFIWLTRAAEGYQEAERAVEAAIVLDEFLQAEPEHPAALSSRADLAARVGDRDIEIAMLERLAPILIAAAETGRAREIVQRLMTLDPGNDDLAGMMDNIDSAPGIAAGGSSPANPGAVASPGAPAVAPEPPAPVEELELPAPVEDPEPLEEVVEILTFEEEAEPVTASAPPAAAIPVAEPSIGSEEQETSGAGSRIQDLQAGAADGGPEDEEFISEHFTEAEVFLKYGLQEKAKLQLQTILGRYPRHADSHRKLKEIYVSEGNRLKAVEECLALADYERALSRDEQARELVNEAIKIDPGSKRAAEYAASLGGEIASEEATAEPAPGPAPSQAESIAASADFDDMDIEIDMVDESPPAPAAAAKPGAPAGRTHTAPIVPPGGDRLGIIPAGGDGLPSTGKAIAGIGPRDPDVEKLGEVDFYIDQGLNEEARQVVVQLQKQYPGSRAVARRLQRLDAPVAPESTPKPARLDDPGGLDLEVERALSGRRGASKPAAAPTKAAGKKGAPNNNKKRTASKPQAVFSVEDSADQPDGDFFDLASELDASLEEAQAAADSRERDALEGAGHSFEDIFQAFKKGVEQQVDSEDYDTHYNLGIAYREMGLVDEAIGEFQFAAKDPSRIIECCGILGLCFRDKGMPDLALQWYKKGLDMPELDDRRSMGLRYDMAEVYRESGDYQNALQVYTDVYGVDSTYRDVAAKIQEMRGLLG